MVITWTAVSKAVRFIIRMGATISAIGDFIRSGFGLPGATRWIWQALSSAFQRACDMFRDLVTSFTFYFNFRRETFWSGNGGEVA